MRAMMTLMMLEFKLEWRQGTSLGAVMLFALGTCYLFSLAFGTVEPRLWNALLWLILVLAATNAAAQSFRRELQYRYTYYHQIASPLALYGAKAGFMFVLLLVLGLISWLSLGLIFGNPVRDYGLLLLTLALGAAGLAFVLTFLAMLAGRARGSTGLVAILAFPVLIPLLLTMVKLGAVALRLIQQTSTSKDILLMGAVDLLALGLAMIMVPLLWREA